MNKNSRSILCIGIGIGLSIKNILAFTFVLGLFQFGNATAEEIGRFGDSGLLPRNTCANSGCHELAIAPAPLAQIPTVTIISSTATTPGGVPVSVTAGSIHTFTISVSDGPLALDPLVPANVGFSVAAADGVLSVDMASPNPTYDSTALTTLPSLEITFGDGGGGAVAGAGGPVDVPVVDPANSTTWTFNWQAPVRTAGGDVIIYAGVVAGDGDRTEIGDGVNMFNIAIPVSASVSTPPVAMISAPATATAGAVVTFDGTGSTFDAGGSIATYIWNFGDASTGSGATPTHTYATAGTYTVNLTVIDDLGVTGTVSSTIVVSAATVDMPPTAIITTPTTGTTGVVGTQVLFDGSNSTDLEGPIASYTWDFGDGSTPMTGSAANYTYTAVGTYTITLTVTDSAGAASLATVDIAISAAAGNQPPLAVITAAPTTGTVGTAISFDGSNSNDPDAAAGDVLTYAWTFGDAAAGTSTLAAPSYTYTVAGTYTISLTVTDAATPAATSTATTTITISDPVGNQPPVAVISTPPTTGTVGRSLTFLGGSSTDDVRVASYSWDFGDGSAAGTGAITSHTYLTAGSFTVTLTVTDDVGLTNTNVATAVVDITGVGNQTPVAVITAPPTMGTVGTAVSFDGSNSSDPDVGDILTYAWSFGDAAAGTSSMAAPSYTYTVAGTYTVSLSVTDNATPAATSTLVTAIITISDPAAGNQAPVAVITAPPTTGTVGTAVSFDGSNSSDPDAGDTITYAWSFGDGTAIDTLPMPTYTYTTAGTFTVTLTVTDSAGATNSATADIVISAAANQPPVALINAPTAGTVGTVVTFDATGSTDDGSIVTYAWDFGDTNTAATATASNTYTAAGTFAVSLTVTDDAGLTNTATTNITISTAANVLPVAAITAPETGVAGTEVAISGSASTDADGTIVNYVWDDVGDGVTNHTGVDITHTYATAGTYIITLTVTDDAGGTNTTTKSIVIDPAVNQPPVAMISGPTTGTAGAMITFSGVSSSDPEGGVLTYAWDIGAGTAGTLVDFSNSFAMGTFTVTLTVTDDMGATGSDSVNIVITAGGGAAQPPVADAGGPYSGVVNTDISFDGSASMDPDAVAGDVLVYDWDFGDNIVLMDAGPMPVHLYTAAGTFTVTLTVTDVDGMSGSSTAAAVIAAAPGTPPPEAGLGEILYVANCENCHGVGGVGTTRAGDVTGEDAEDIAKAIVDVPTMNSLSGLTDEELKMIADFLNGGPSGAGLGEALYVANCESCHGVGGSGGSGGDVTGEDAEDIAEAIVDVPTMNSLSVLTDEELMLIAHFLNGGEPDQDDVAVSASETLYLTFCASCHGAGGKGGIASPVIGATVADVKAAITRESTMAIQVSLVSDQYITDIVKYLEQPVLDKPTGNNGAVSDGGGGALLWLLGLAAGARMLTRRRRWF